MRLVKTIAAALFLLFVISAAAQESMEDVVYLKSGNIYRGIIIEQVPNESIKIQIAGGSVFSIAVSEIQKITKEQRWKSPYKTAEGGTSVPTESKPAASRYTKQDSSYIPRYKKKKGYFFLAELRGGPANGGVRIINGYKFGRFGFLGAGVGVDGASFSAFMGPNMGNGNFRSDGLYLPIVIRYQGDILRTRITPFYYVEAGYAFHPTDSYMFDPEIGSHGGPIATAGFGCKFNTKRRVNFNVNINATWRSNFYTDMYPYYDQNGNYIGSYTQRGRDSRVFGNVCFGVGF
ncbi:MAG: hypothetical protein KIS94_14230 [Chitinophagales bacterium]|nr:hypothetical protein [Chitinophagales bacterium]